MIDQLLSIIPEKIEGWPFLWLSALLTYTIGLILFRLVRIIFRRRGFEEHKMIEKARKPTSLLFALLVGRLFTEHQFGELTSGWSQVFEILVIALMSWLTIQLIAIGRYFLTRQYDINVDQNVKARKVYTQIKVFERIIIVIILITGISLCLMTFDSIRSLGASILASAGIISVIVGLASQKLIANLIAGFQIAVTQPIRLDDVVIVEGEWGKIEEITLTYVVINIWDKRRLVVPSSQFIEKPFQNWTRNDADILGTVFIYVDYKLPVGVVREHLSEILKSTDLWDGKTDVLQVTNLTDRTMELRALVSAKDSPTAWDLRVLVREKLIEFLQVEYPQYLPKARVELDSVISDSTKQTEGSGKISAKIK